MKNIFSGLALMVSTLSSTNLMNAQPVQTNLTAAITPTIVLTSSGRVFYNTGVFPDSFQLWRVSNGPLTQSNAVGNPAPSVSFSGSGHDGSHNYKMGSVASDLILQADVMFTNASTAEGIYLLFRIADSINFYGAKYGPYYGGIMVFSKNIGGSSSSFTPVYGVPSSANTWYNLEVRAIGSSLQFYFDHTLKLTATDASLTSGFTSLSFGTCCSASNTWYVDNIKIFKSYEITVTNLQPGQKLELSDSTGSLKTSSTVAAGKTSLVLNASSFSFPFAGCFKVYDTTGTSVLFTSQTYSDIWGGDNYNFIPSSPTEDKTQIAFHSNRDGNQQIYLMNIDGTNQQRLSNNTYNDHGPVWSPDGSKIAFNSFRDGNYEVYVMNRDGTNQQRLTNNPADDRASTWSPDGSKIGFQSTRDGNWEIYLMNADGTNQQRLTNNPGEDAHPNWSPDGAKIAFYSTRDGNPEIYVMNADGTNLQRLTNNSAEDYVPKWSPDGSKIAFISNRDGNFEIYVMNSNGTNPQRLTNNLADDEAPSWSPDGSKIAFETNRDGNYEIYIMNADGTNPQRLTNNSALDSYPAWSPLMPNGNILLSVASVTSRVGDTATVPIRVTFPTGKNYSSSEIALAGYHGGLRFLGLDTSSTLIGSQRWMYQVNGTDSVVITASAGANDISGSGILFKARFKVLSPAAGFIPINIQHAVFNIGGDTVVSLNGGVKVLLTPVYGDVDKNGQIQAADAAAILKYLVGIDTLDAQSLANADVTNNGFVSALDATAILKYVVHLITSFPADSTTMGPLSAQGAIAMNNSIPSPLGSVVEVPLNLSHGSNILSFEGKITFDPNSLSWRDVTWSPLLSNFTVRFAVDSTAGILRFTGACSLPDGNEGKFASLFFSAKKNGTSSVALKELRWNEGPKATNLGSTDIVTAADVARLEVPKEYALSQNYPNPFNPSTRISYQLPFSSFVTLRVYDVLGREAATLVRQKQDAGYNQIEWQPIVPSGVYFYRIEAVSQGNAVGCFTDVKKMLLLR